MTPYKDPEIRRQRQREAQARYRKANPSRGAEWQRRWRAEHPEKHRADVKEYELRHRKECPSCGTLMGRTAKLCADCSRRQKGAASGGWKGGRYVDRRGYIYIHTPDHPRATKAKYVYEHRLVMEKVLGRYLRTEENVHHINGIRDDNRPENLELWTSSQPKGQRVVDLLAWANQIVDMYSEEFENRDREGW